MSLNAESVPTHKIASRILHSRRLSWRPRFHAPSRRAKFCIVFAFGLFLGAMFAIYQDVSSYDNLAYTNLTAVPNAPVAIVFGAGYAGHTLSDVLEDRVSTAVDLYRAGKVQKLLMTGDNGTVDHNEPDAMKREAIRLGVPPRDIACDYAGFRTYDSVYRARYIFGVSRAILVTQEYHLPRALFTANGLGIKAVGMAADKRPYFEQDWFSLREIFSRERAWWDVRIAHAHPKYLGKHEPLF